MNRPGNRFTESPKTPPTPEVPLQEVPLELPQT